MIIFCRIFLIVATGFLLPFAVLAQEKTDSTAVEQELEEVELEAAEVSTKRPAVERKADRVIYNFSDQAYLNSGS